MHTTKVKVCNIDKENKSLVSTNMPVKIRMPQLHKISSPVTGFHA